MAGENQFPVMDKGIFTSAGTAADVTVTLGFRPSVVVFVQNTGGTNPNIYIRNDAAPDKVLLVTGSTGVVTVLADAASIHLDNNFGFTIESGIQTNSGTNFWIAWR